MISFIKKRDGRIESFTPQKIANAVMAAMKKCNKVDPELAATIGTKIYNSSDKNIIEIEEVQDMVELELMGSDYKDVAKEYITYRQERSRKRQFNNTIIKKINSTLNCENIQNSNANVDEASFGGRKNESVNILQKELALNLYMSKDVADAHINNEVYTHDLSEYPVGLSNCLFTDMGKLLREGFNTRNGDIRPANSYASACQLVAVIFQCASQALFGGVAAPHIDYDLAPFVRKSFIKHYKTGLEFVETDETITWERLKDDMADAIAMQFTEDCTDENIIRNIESTCFITKDLENYSPKAYKYAMHMLKKEGRQGSEALYHNLNTLESRPGSQLPFTSINFGRDTSVEGRMVSKWLMEASINGIGKYHQTPIFPISILKYKKGVNDKPGTPNYDLKQLAIKSLSKRIYPR